MKHYKVKQMQSLSDNQQTSNTLSAPRFALSESVAATMSSREIAELVGSRHADVMRTIDRLIEKNVVLGCTPSAYTHEQNGQPYAQYLVSKRDSFVVVAQLCPEFTASATISRRPRPRAGG